MKPAARVIENLRQGIAPSPDDLANFAAGLADGTITDAQAGAFAMGVCVRGLGQEGRTTLTNAMRDSGTVMKWNFDAPCIDKHSTGGVGDCVSLILAPALAACGARVPMISGRGLGHTGGTLDKLEAITGVSCELSEQQFRQIVETVGCAIVAASDAIAPADCRLYGIRNESSTVPSLDLITASILSKKLAAGLHALVLDVKVGSGAFASTLQEAQTLAEALVRTANAAGCATCALLTHMDEPLASSVGNGLEVRECMDVLTGAHTNTPLLNLSATLGGEVLSLAGLCATPQEGAEQVHQAITGGHAAEIFGEMIMLMGGPGDFVSKYETHLPQAPVVCAVLADQSGYVQAIDGRVLGEAVIDLGGGRRKAGDPISPGVGLSHLVGLGAQVRAGDEIAHLHADTPEAAKALTPAVANAFVFGEALQEPPALVRGRVG